MLVTVSGSLPGAYATLPHSGPLAVAAGLGALRQWWHRYLAAAPCSRHFTLNGPRRLGCRPSALVPMRSDPEETSLKASKAGQMVEIFN